MLAGGVDAGLRADGIEVSFGGTHVLRGASISVVRGVTALLGENGAGKTTLMRALVGLVSPSAGSVTAAGRSTPRQAARRKARSMSSVGYMPQAVPVLRHLTVVQYLGYIAYLKGISRADAVGEVASVLAQVDLAQMGHARTTRLSGGMRRRLGLAAALIGHPAVLLLDEPTVGLDPTQRLRMREIVGRIGRQRAVLVSTHLAEDVAAIADMVVVLDRGRTVFSGTLADFASPTAGSVTATDVERAFLALVRGEAR